MRTKTDSQNLRRAEARLDEALELLDDAKREVQDAVKECRRWHMPLRRLAEALGTSKTTVHRGRWRLIISLTER